MTTDDSRAQTVFHSLASIRFKHQVGLHGPMPGMVTLTVDELRVLLDLVDELTELRRSLVEGTER